MKSHELGEYQYRQPRQDKGLSTLDRKEPKSYAPSVLGIILELTSALNTILSAALSPKTMLPSVPAAKVTTPTKNELPVTDSPAPTDNPAPTVRLPAIPAPPSI